MRKLSSILYMFVAMIVAASFTACSDDDNYEWANKVSADNPGVYFAASNQGSVLLTPEEYAAKQSVTVTLKRLNTNGDLAVPVVIDDADKVFSIPTVANFKAGEAETTIEVACPGMEMSRPYSFIVHIDEAYSNPYAKTDGAPTYKYQATLIRWVKISEATFVWDGGEFSDSKSDIYWLEGQNRFRFNNFLGSGIDWEFYILASDPVDSSVHSEAYFNPKDRSTWHGIPYPYTNWMMDPEGLTCWYLMKDVAKGEYAKWYPDGEEFSGIEKVNFWLDPSDEWWSNIDMRGSAKKACFKLIPQIFFTDGGDSGWGSNLIGYWDSINIE